MKKETRYGYEKRIRELSSEINILREYRLMANNIFVACTDNLMEGKGISAAWIVRQYKAVFK